MVRFRGIRRCGRSPVNSIHSHRAGRMVCKSCSQKRFEVNRSVMCEYRCQSPVNFSLVLSRVLFEFRDSPGHTWLKSVGQS
jgi:hypothetical protein